MTRLSLTVTGMSCTGCEGRIASALRRLDGVRHVEAGHRAGSVLVEYDAQSVTPAAVTRRLTDAGYDVVPGTGATS